MHNARRMHWVARSAARRRGITLGLVPETKRRSLEELSQQPGLRTL